jgi:hypothetical protein
MSKLKFSLQGPQRRQKRQIYNIYRFIYAQRNWQRKRLTAKGLSLFICLFFSAALGLDTNQTTAYQIFAFLLAIWLIAIAFSFFFPFRCQATRILPRFATVGVKLKYRIILHNKTNQTQQGLKLIENLADPRPTYQEWLDTPEPNEAKKSKIDKSLGYYRWSWLITRKLCAIPKPINLPPLPPNSQTEITLEIEPLHRGIARFHSFTIARGDPFDLFNACKTFSLPQSLLILPKIYQVPPVKLPGSRRYQSGGIALASSVGDSEEFRALRDYRPGDSLRKIHWKSWAKIGKPIVKEEQDEFFVRHALILDNFQQEKYSQLLEEAISVAASFACEVQTQESLLDLMFVGTEAYCFTFGRGLSHTDKMLEILASVVPCQEKSFDYLTPVIMKRTEILSGCICVFIAWDASRQKLVNYLRAARIPTLVLILAKDKNELDLKPVADKLMNVQVLELGKIQEGLMQI